MRLRSSLADTGVLAFVDEPVWLMRRHLGALVAIILPARLISILPSTAGQALTWGATSDDGLFAMALGTALTYGGIFFSMLVMGAGFTALAWGVDRCSRGLPAPTGQAWRFAVQPAVLSTSILAALIVAFGSAFCLVPGLFATMYLALVLPVMAAEGSSGGTALDRSIALARHGKDGPWFTTTGAWALCLTVAYFLLNYAVGSLVTLPAAIVGGYFGFRAAAEGAPIEDITAMLPASLAVVINLSGAFLYVIADIYLMAACHLLYRRALDLLEGADLREALLDEGAAGAVP